MIGYRHIGSEHYLRFEWFTPRGYVTQLAKPKGLAARVGLTLFHYCEGEWCGCWIGFSNVLNSRERANYVMTRESPLTVAPKIVCGACGDSGEIAEGLWVPLRSGSSCRVPDGRRVEPLRR